MNFALADCEKIAIENPVGFMNTAYRPADQIFSPYMFAESEKDIENYVTKRTCLWLKGLPKLKTNNLPKPNNEELFGKSPVTGKAYCWCDRIGKNRAVNRSKTFTAVSKAMAEQWGGKAVD